jgi:hypothetical protein
MFVFLVCFYCGDYFAFGIFTFGIRAFFGLGIATFLSFGILSSPIPERRDAPSNPIRISGDPILMDEELDLPVALKGAGFAGDFAGVDTIGFFLL